MAYFGFILGMIYERVLREEQKEHFPRAEAQPLTSREQRDCSLSYFDFKGGITLIITKVKHKNSILILLIKII